MTEERAMQMEAVDARGSEATSQFEIGAHNTSGRAAAAEARLRNALHELKQRGENVAEDVRAAALPVRVIGTALAAGLGAVCLLMAVRAMTRTRRPKRRTIRGAVARSLAAELATRAALGAAGVVGARLASDVLMPALVRRLAAEAGEATTPKKKRTRARGGVEPMTSPLEE